MKKIIQQLTAMPSALLLVVQLISIAVYPMLESVKYHQAILSCFNVTALLLAVWVVNRSPAVNWVAWALAIPAIALSMLYVSSGNAQYLIFAQALESAMYFYTAAGLVMYMFKDHILTRDELFAAAATFTVLAWGFALAYSVCQQIYPGSIVAGVHPEQPRVWAELMFMSFSIMSSTGFGDVITVHPIARVIATFQMFCGLMYMALIVSRVVSLSYAAKKN